MALVLVVALLLPAQIGASTATIRGESGPSSTGSPVETEQGRLPTGPRIVAAYPNPVAPNDAGEYVVLSFPRPVDLEGWRLADDDATVSLPNATVAGHVAFSTEPDRARNLTGADVRRLPGGLELANSGGTLRLLSDGATVDAVTYRNAPEGEFRRWTGEGRRGRWQALGATDHPIVHTDGGTVRAFVLPDAAGVPVATLRSADERILLAGYTLTSRRAVEALISASRRGVRVRVLVDGEPVGGMTRREARLLDRLVAAGIAVDVQGGPRARYEFHHPKYAVVDERALVLTENWKPSGTGGHTNRGWGVVLDDPAVTRALTRVFRTDRAARDARAWRSVREGRSFQPGGAANATYPSRFTPLLATVDRASVIVAPDNAERAVVGRIDRAEESVRVLQASIGGPGQPFLQAVLRAARRGVRVRILVSGKWYLEEENRRLVEWVDGRAAAEGLPLEARVADPQGRFGKVHAKGVIIDGHTTILGSLNWNNHSARQNREVAVVLESEAVARYYRRAFLADWRGGAWRLPVGLLGAMLVGVSGAILAGRRIEFE